MDLSTKSRVWMVGKVPKNLIKWWDMFNYVEQRELEKKLGTLISLLSITPRPNLIEAALSFWDPTYLVLRFGSCEMMPNLAEISNLFGFPYIKKTMIQAQCHFPNRFLHRYGLKVNNQLGCLNQSWISFDYLYAWFGLPD